ncbi:ATP synthase subunit delta [Microbotryum lychnidis-dioicae p1A1 Lamole]|uniref:ATP synthase subunit delta, mitochondrial n=2 Tax=Microbotryum TaxID=34416 RepID=U5HEN3_USTV1|nr:ATP synthase subunit delta [Microbotryum lychnidis-dioicae p1A1 Lamole]SGZ26816.1 BQ5605_C025g09965 [Microbotryum silenes-dioicae]|eukprot:KDE03942.1 ATP synthase subunit delta [Microbotryum lychnidis-dioicae p1A1 Lamole]
MFAVARRSLFVAPRLARGYAEAASEKLRLSLVLPHETIYNRQDVVQVNLSAVSGDMGILANHVPIIEALAPGVLEVIEGSSNETKKWFVSGGFANVHPNNLLTVNAVEAYPLDAFSPEAIRSALSEAQRVASGSGDAAEKAEAQVEVEVYEALQTALKA